MDYRREIDGFRTLALLPVMLFHAGFEKFSGGFVGVDVGLFNGGGSEQLIKQIIGAGAVLGYSFIATLIIGYAIDKTIGLRVSKEIEVEGIDLKLHAESAYEMYSSSRGGSSL